MAITAARSGRVYSMLCDVLERNEIKYEINGNTVTCLVNGHDGDIKLMFNIDTSKMLVTLYSPLGGLVPYSGAGDISLALCMINNSVSDGAFCYDITNRLIYFRMTSSFYNSGPTDFIFEYMLSAAADTVDEYRPKLRRLMGCFVS